MYNELSAAQGVNHHAVKISDSEKSILSINNILEALAGETAVTDSPPLALVSSADLRCYSDFSSQLNQGSILPLVGESSDKHLTDSGK